MAKRRVGVLGGTFDPLHYGHLAAASGAMHLAGLDQVVFVPAGQNPLKAGQATSPAAHRLAMVEAGIAGAPGFSVSTVDLTRPGPHYTVDTLALLAASHPEWEIHFIAGLDALLEVERWRDYQRLLAAHPVLAVTRPGTDLAAWEQVRARLGPALARSIRVLTIPGVAVAARDLRALAARGYPLRYLVPEAVRLYIEREGLYTGAPRAGGEDRV